MRYTPENEEIHWLDRQAFPFSSLYFESPAGRMHFVDEGEGPPIVMVHGNPTWSFLYRHAIKHFRSDYRCVAMDHLGFGLSDKPAAWDYKPQNHAENLARLIDHLNLQDITLVVQDWGGPIGLSYALDNPQNVRRVLIMNTWLWPVNREFHYVSFSKLLGGPLGRFLIRNFNLFARVVMRQAYGDKSKLTDQIHQQYILPLDEPHKRKGSWVFPGQILGATAWLQDLWDRRDNLKDIPKSIVWGMKDIGFREKELNHWTAHFPQATVVRLAGVGHYVQEEAPWELNAAIERLIS